METHIARIAEPHGIEEVLSRAVSGRHRLNALVTQVPAVGHTAFLALSMKDVLLSPLRPAAVHSLMRPGVFLVMSFEERGVLYWFPSRVAKVLADTHDFVIALPRLLWRVQRRESYRVTPSASLPARVLAVAGLSDVRGVSVEDVSAKGIALTFSSDPGKLLATGVLSFTVGLSNFGVVELSAEVRSKRRLADGRVRLGLEFRRTAVAADKALSQFVSARQREELREGIEGARRHF